MNQTSHIPDQLERFYTEKLWGMLPVHHRDADVTGRQPGALRALVSVIGAQAAQLRRSHDRLWEDQSVESCDDWVLPYLADFVATSLVAAQNPRGQRLDVVKSVYYRRRKGTIQVLEELLHDITGWDGKVSESFRRLARTRHRLDAAVTSGPWSQTPRGGLADLRATYAATQVGTAFDEYAHTVDCRSARGRRGGLDLHTLNMDVALLQAYKIEGVTPFRAGHDQRYAADPSGRAVPLFQPRLRASTPGTWRSAAPWSLPGPLDCRLLNHAAYMLTSQDIETLSKTHALSVQEREALQSLQDLRMRTAAEMRQALAHLASPALLAAAFVDAVLGVSLVQDCGKSTLWGHALQVKDGTVAVASDDGAAGDLSTWLTQEPGKEVIVDPKQGLVQWFGVTPTTPSLDIHVGSFGRVGAGAYPRPHVESRVVTDPIQGGMASLQGTLPSAGVVQIDDSRTYTGVASINGVSTLTMQAANLQRPYLRLTQDWVLEGQSNGENHLVLDGLWLGAEAPAGVILRGEFASVQIRGCSFDPGATQVGDQDVLGQPILPVLLWVEGSIKELNIQESVLSTISIPSASGLVESLVVEDSILDAKEDHQNAIFQPQGETVLRRTTVMGALQVHRLQASETLCSGIVTVTDVQRGCFRFSAAPSQSRLPASYRSVALKAGQGLFQSRRFGEPRYGMLAQMAPVAVREGGPEASCMGVYAREIEPIKRKGLLQKLRSYAPFHQRPVVRD